MELKLLQRPRPHLENSGLISIRSIKLRMYLLYRKFCFKSNLTEFLALYGGNLDFLDKFLALAYARTKILSKKS